MPDSNYNPYRRDGSLTIGAQIMECWYRNKNDAHSMLGFGEAISRNTAHAKGMFTGWGK